MTCFHFQTTSSNRNPLYNKKKELLKTLTELFENLKNYFDVEYRKKPSFPLNQILLSKLKKLKCSSNDIPEVNWSLNWTKVLQTSTVRVCFRTCKNLLGLLFSYHKGKVGNRSKNFYILVVLRTTLSIKEEYNLKQNTKIIVS